MTKPYSAPLAYGDGSYKIFGMENFGNTCYCNSILQCLYYTTSFRNELLKYKSAPHDRRTTITGSSYHTFTAKYEQLVAKRLREQGKTPVPAADSNGLGVPTKPSIRNSLFGKFSSSSTPQVSADGPTDSPYKKLGYIQLAELCMALLTEQRLIIKKNPEFHNLQMLVTRPTTATTENRNDNSQSSAALLDSGNNNNGSVQNAEADTESSQSSFVVVGIPSPEKNLVNPINPFNANPSADQRKRLALINGPILNLDHSLQIQTEKSSDTVLLYALKDIFEAMVENQSQIGVVSPLYFVNKLKEKNFLFRQVNMHQDAHEFCNYLINETIESLNHEVGAQNNWCTDIFQGTITNETKCLSCETITSKDESFLDLSIDIPPGESAYSLVYSLNNFSKLETLNHQNKFYCNTCLSLQEAVKTIKLKKTPEVLVINFKRFKYDEKLDRMVKLFDSILYPLKLRLFNTTTPDNDKKAHPGSSDDFTLYGLYALVVHIGGGPMHGHYVALCKCKAGLWFFFDDETVELVDELFVLRFFGNGPGLASAYILFYEKLDTKLDDDGLDLGIDLHGIYNGSDYSVAMQKPSTSSIPLKTSVPLKTGVEESDSNISEDEDIIQEYREPLLETSTGSVGRRTSIFKKTFMFDSTARDGNEEPITKSVSRSSSTKDTEGPLAPKLATTMFEKKSWVNGLKRRELRNEIAPADRKASMGSIKTTSSSIKSEKEPEKERRRSSIFSFKRKSKN
ncbi:CIC11C00000004138 [Sungouiella intermedia]|uniref:Ubiquitin carboxyl-terminal hydrolase n=1 Tax=Sungouiella intermedia TaxID=45354 RepID=A0A1L0BQC3_9ASCO|nr:CIC11C00000004138 [[Candida] intermedia]